MNFTKFKEKFRELPFISARSVVTAAAGDRQIMRNQLTRWGKNGLIIQLKRGVYMLNKNDQKLHPSRFFLANQLLWPSYVSLESALGYYGLIPEAVADVTSVTTKKTSRFNNPIGRFVYQRVKPDAFRGYRSYKDEAGLDCLIAEPEKAVADFLYLNVRRYSKPRPKTFLGSRTGFRTPSALVSARFFRSCGFLKTAVSMRLPANSASSSRKRKHD